MCLGRSVNPDTYEYDISDAIPPKYLVPGQIWEQISFFLLPGTTGYAVLGQDIAVRWAVRFLDPDCDDIQDR